VRVPFLDYTFVEWAATLGVDMKLRGRECKVVLKKALEPLLPREVLYRAKMGFAVPLDLWFSSSLKERMTASLQSGALTRCGLFEPKYLSRIGADHVSGRRDHSAVLWALLMFEGFLENAGKSACADSPFIGAETVSA
jgi:asparagine synthase (glutamine-hydrolysing)